MAAAPTRLSPVHDHLEALEPQWGALDGMPVALCLGGRTLEQEQSLAWTLSLCDVSALHRLVIKGLGAAGFLEAHAVADALPAEVFRVVASKSGGLIARTGRSEFFLEDTPGARGEMGIVAPLAESLLTSPQPDIYPAFRQDASFLLGGELAPAVFLQTCGHDFRQPGPGLDPSMVMVMTRVAGVSTWVLKRTLNGNPVFQLWLDGTYGAYVWETLLTITRELGGDAVGLSLYFPGV